MIRTGSVSFGWNSFTRSSSEPFVGLERERMGVFGAAGIAFGVDEPPIGCVPVGETGVALVGVTDARQIESVGNRKRFGINLRAADDENSSSDGKSASASSSEWTTSHPSIASSCLEITTLRRLGSGRPSDSNVLRPMTTG